MTLRRAIVQGYDTGSSQPKGVSSAVDVRQSVSALAIRSGVFRDVAGACQASATITMAVEIASFRAAIESALGGFYFITEDDTGSVNLAAADSTNNRIDLICVRQNDYQVDGAEVDSEVEYVVVTGTPGVSPTAPSVPANAYALWEALVPAGATSTDDGVVFTQRFAWTAPVGATVPLASASELTGLNPGVGATALVLASALELHRRHDAGWVTLGTNFKVADLAALASLTRMASGDIAVVLEGGALFRYTGTAWLQVTPATFASTGARDTAYAKASAAYRVAGAEANITITGSPRYLYNGSAWVLWNQRLTAWTPAVTAIALGSTGTATGKYRVVDGWCEYWGKLQFLGTSPSISASPRHSLPLTPSTTWDDDVWMVEQSLYRDASVTLTDLSSMKPMINFFDPATGDVRMSPLYAGASSSPVDYVEMSKVSTGYGTVAANDYITFRGSFPLAGADT